MDHFTIRDNQLYAEAVPAMRIAAEVGTPVYIYARAALEGAWQAFDHALNGRDHLICYAVKANSNIALLQLLARQGSGFDIVSAGELARVIRAGGDPGKVVFSGVGKTDAEIRYALEAGILCFNVESASELHALDRIAGDMGTTAAVSLRVNPDVDAGTHPYISTGLRENKFGIDIHEAVSLYQHAATLAHIRITGVDCHIGSQLVDLDPLRDALQRVAALVTELQDAGIELEHIDVGGGLGIRYQDEEPPSAQDYGQLLQEIFGDFPQKLILEPGRAISGNAGILLTRVQYLKHGSEKNFAIVDAAMNDLLRPALYNAWQKIDAVSEQQNVSVHNYDVVGPVCETGDFLGKDRPLAIQRCWSMVKSSISFASGKTLKISCRVNHCWRLIDKRPSAANLRTC
jgi:diaminopimelate decarboxylase